MDKNLHALTTGQAARYCFVSSDTIANWIRADCLPAQRTFGGQYRILIDDLRHFMTRHGMSTDLLDQEMETRCYCWEYHSGCGKPVSQSPCENCPAFKSLAFNCFHLRGAIQNGPWLRLRYAECSYFHKWGELDFQEGDAQAPMDNPPKGKKELQT